MFIATLSKEVFLEVKWVEDSALQWSVCSANHALQGRRSIHEQDFLWIGTEILFLFQMAPDGGNLEVLYDGIKRY